MMRTNTRLLHDAARIATSAASTVVGIKQEIDSLIRQRIERLVAEFDLVTREEFDAVKETAANARAAQEALEARVAALEKAAKKPRTTRKAAATD